MVRDVRYQGRGLDPIKPDGRDVVYLRQALYNTELALAKIVASVHGVVPRRLIERRDELRAAIRLADSK